MQEEEGGIAEEPAAGVAVCSEIEQVGGMCLGFSNW